MSAFLSAFLGAALTGAVDKTTFFVTTFLTLALTSVLMKDSLDKETFTAAVVSEAKAALQEFKLEQPEEDDEI